MKKQHPLLRYQYLLVALAVIAFEVVLLATQPHLVATGLEYWWMVPIAFAFSLVANVAGISSAALFVPFFILAFPLLSGTYLATVDTVKLGLITESFGLTSSALAFLAFGLVDLRIAVRSFLSALPFVVVGVAVVAFVPSSILYLMVAALLVVSVLLLHFEETLRRKRDAREKLHIPESTAHARGDTIIERTGKDGIVYRYIYTPFGTLKRSIGYAVGGVFQGATGFGIGEVGIISMLLSHIPVRIAIGTSHLIVALTAITATAVHFLFATETLHTGTAFPWVLPLLTVPAVFLAGQAAPHIAAKIPARYLERFVSALFIAIAGALVTLALNG